MSDEKKMAYTVQMLVHQGSEDQEGWQDIATVMVAPRTKRSTVIKLGLKQAGIDPTGEAPKVRALDAESACVHTPEAHQPAPEWRL